MQLTEEQSEKLGNLFKVIKEYKELNAGNNLCIKEAKSNFMDEVCPKPSGKMTAKDKEFYKEKKKDATTFLKESIRVYLLKTDSEVEELHEAVDKVSGMR